MDLHQLLPMCRARHPLRLLLLAMLGLSVLSVNAQMSSDNGTFTGLLDNERLASGKLHFCERPPCQLGPSQNLILLT